MKNKTFYAVKLSNGEFLSFWKIPYLFSTLKNANLLKSQGREIVRVELREIKPKARKEGGCS